jgi:chromosome segregation ATPase
MKNESSLQETLELMKTQASLVASVNSLRLEEEEVKARLASLIKERENALLSQHESVAELNTWQEKVKLAKSKLAKLEENISSMEESNAFTYSQSVHLLSDIEENKQEHKRLMSAITELKSAISQAEYDLNQKKESLDKEWLEYCAEFEKAKSGLHGEIATLQKASSDAQQEIDACKRGMVEIQEGKERMFESVTRLRAEESEINERLISKKEELEDITMSLSEKKKEHDAISAKIDEFNAMKAGLIDKQRDLDNREELLRTMYGDVGLNWK